MGIYTCTSAAEVQRNFPLAVSQGEKSFGNGDVFVEKFIQRAKHIEVQVLGDGEGEVRALGERECSVQRRHQKVVEIAPAPNLDQGIREALFADAIAIARHVGYVNAGTVEFMVDKNGDHFFLEVNPRIQARCRTCRVVLRWPRADFVDATAQRSWLHHPHAVRRDAL